MRQPPATAIITGASSGIGREMAIQLARQGTRVGAIARRGDLLDSLIHEANSPGMIVARIADVGNPTQLRSAIAELLDELGSVELFVANAGVGLPSAVGPKHADGVEAMTRINFLGVVHSFDAVLPTMQAQGQGHLVAISSMAAYKGLPGSAGYCASKAALLTYCESLRIELKQANIAVTCVCPGFVRTAMTAQNDHPMPWIIDAEPAAKRILRALRKRPAVYDFPKRMRLLMWLAKWAPDRFMAKRVPVTVATTP